MMPPVYGTFTHECLLELWDDGYEQQGLYYYDPNVLEFVPITQLILGGKPDSFEEVKFGRVRLTITIEKLEGEG